MKRIFVTGGAGFIGSHLVDKLISEGDFVTAYDNLLSGRREWIEHHDGKENFNFIEADLLDFDTLKEAMKGHDIIWHLGANTNIPAGTKRTDLDLKNCIIGTYNTLEAMRQNEINIILFASSATVYGDTLPIPLSETYGPLLPISLYGAGKLACEGLISAYSHLFGIKAWIFRFANVIGGRTGRAVIYDFIEKLRKNKKEMKILGDGKQEKPFFLVEECIEGMICAFEKSGTQYDIFNLGCPTTTNITRVAQIVAEEMGLHNVKFKYTGGRRGWPGDIPESHFNVEKIKKLGWSTKHTSDEAVRITVKRQLNENSKLK